MNKKKIQCPMNDISQLSFQNWDIFIPKDQQGQVETKLLNHQDSIFIKLFSWEEKQIKKVQQVPIALIQYVQTVKLQNHIEIENSQSNSSQASPRRKDNNVAKIYHILAKNIVIFLKEQQRIKRYQHGFSKRNYIHLLMGQMEYKGKLNEFINLFEISINDRIKNETDSFKIKTLKKALEGCYLFVKKEYMESIEKVYQIEEGSPILRRKNYLRAIQQISNQRKQLNLNFCDITEVKILQKISKNKLSESKLVQNPLE